LPIPTRIEVSADSAREVPPVRLLEGGQLITKTQVTRNTRAGIALAAMNIPQVLGYTRIAGMPIATGLYTLLLPLLAFAALGSSRYLVVAADSATAAILASGLAGLAPTASAQYVDLARTSRAESADTSIRVGIGNLTVRHSVRETDRICEPFSCGQKAAGSRDFFPTSADAP
jgi:hypothetical protein